MSNPGDVTYPCFDSRICGIPEHIVVGYEVVVGVDAVELCGAGVVNNTEVRSDSVETRTSLTLEEAPEVYW